MPDLELLRQQSYEANVSRQFKELMADCLSHDALPFLLICIDKDKRGHMFYPDDLPAEIVKALPALLDDVRESLQSEPL